MPLLSDDCVAELGRASLEIGQYDLLAGRESARDRRPLAADDADLDGNLASAAVVVHRHEMLVADMC